MEKDYIKLLIAEDDENLAYMEKMTLEDIIGGYEVHIANNGKKGLEAWKTFNPHVIVADIEMPEMDGMEMVRRIREVDHDTIILMATGVKSANSLLEGYAIGIDNYVKKPFIPQELDAHIRSLLRMRRKEDSRNEVSLYRFGKFVLDTGKCTLLHQETGKTQTLTKREAGILQLLIENQNEVVRREVFLSRFWQIEGKDFFSSRSLDVFVAKLRKYMEEDESLELKTVRGIGLSLMIPTTKG
ncbi:MAG: response regulator transcription factor [Prevotella sp.]|nr:response regulator transcription factor [Prevotella sp.]